MTTTQQRTKTTPAAHAGKDIQNTQKLAVDKKTPSQEPLEETTQGILTEEQRKTLRECEDVISKGLEKFIETGRALARIKDEELYKEDYENWDDYLEGAWGIARSTSYGLIKAAKVVENLSANGGHTDLPDNERQVRPLTRLKPADQCKAWKRAREIAGNDPITGDTVTIAVEEILGGAAGKPPSLGKWHNAISMRLRKAGYERVQEQPVTMGQEGVDFYDSKLDLLVKLKERISLKDVAFILALKGAAPRAVIVLNGDRFMPKGLEKGEDGAIIGLCDEIHSVLIAQLGILVSYKGKLYGDGSLDDQFKLTLKPVTDEATKALEKAMAANRRGRK